MPTSKSETGFVAGFFTQRGYGFVTRDGQESSLASDIQLHIHHAKGQKLKAHVKKHGVKFGSRIRYIVDYEENRGKPYAAQWEILDRPELRDSSRSRSGAGRARASPSYGRGRRAGRRRSPSYGRGRRSASPGRGRRKGAPPDRGSPPSKRPVPSASKSRSRSWSRRRPRSKSR
mmetsp:Transcript_28197/g.81197  ORF Transcript_28197/g.81197 Transcript_28197/m.81197 type:complete len:174 (-) Transcript_28197:46-567(-)